MKIKLNLFAKILSGYIIAIIAINILTSAIISNVVKFQAIAFEVENEILPNTLNAKDLQIHVIQVQQWLTDISATRGAEGFDDGYDEAESHAQEFRRIVGEFKKYYLSKNLTEKVSSMENMLNSFNDFYEVGKKMAASYIEFGPDEGNKYMEKFDPFASKLYDNVNEFVETESGLLINYVTEIDEKSSRLYSISSVFGITSSILLLVVGFIISRIISKPIKEFTSILKDISEGEGDLTRKIVIESTDEIGNMATYFNQTFEKIRILVSNVHQQAEFFRKAWK